MSYLQNLHTHSTFCDGANTPEQTVLIAIEKGFDSIGFSGHSYMKYSPTFQKMGDRTAAYRAEISRLRSVYADRINVYCGLEAEMYSDAALEGFDYLIGASHYLMCGAECVPFDRTAQHVEQVIDTYFGGDGMAYAKKYFETVACLPERGRFDIVAHFDLVAKHCETHHFFDTDAPAYVQAGLEAIDALAGKIPFFELNTGAMARGYRTAPYPAPAFLRAFKERGFGAVITSDCHNASLLDYGFCEAAALLRAYGFTEKYVLTDSGFTAVALD